MNWLVIVFAIEVLLLLGVGFWIMYKIMTYIENIIRQRRNRQLFKTGHFTVHLLTLIISSNEEQENIIGDLLEEFENFPTKTLAHLWLSKQVIKSLLPLIYKKIKARLASRFGKRIR